MRAGNPTIPGTSSPTILQVYAALVGINGELRPRGWGSMTSGADIRPYGRVGLETSEEAFLLTEMTAFAAGMTTGRGDVESFPLEIVEAINAEHVRAVAARGIRIGR
jgi:hypothetical protein